MKQSGYPHKGKLGAALKDFKLGIAAGLHEKWPLFWKEFADQAFADLIALEVEMVELKEKADKYEDLLY